MPETATARDLSVVRGSAGEQMVACFDRGFVALREHIASHWPQHESRGDLHEVNLAFHVGAAFREEGCLVYFEVPHAGGTGARCDLLVLNPADRWALAAEFKNVTSQAKDVDFADDARRLRALRLLASTGAVERRALACHVALAIGTWTPAHRDWWMASGPRAEAPAGARRPAEWADIRAFLDESTTVRATDLRVKAPHWGLLAAMPSPSGSFWS